jgi:hypothetical protein
VVTEADEGLRYYEGGGAVSPVSQRERYIAMYAYLLASAARNLGTAHSAAGDAAGAERHLARAAAATTRPGFEAFERECTPPRSSGAAVQACLAFDAPLLHCDALRACGRLAEAVAPLRAAATLARQRLAAARASPGGSSGGDDSRDGAAAWSLRVSAAAGTLGGVLLSLGQAREARECCAEDARLCGARGDASGEAEARINLGNAELALAHGVPAEERTRRIDDAAVEFRLAAATADALQAQLREAEADADGDAAHAARAAAERRRVAEMRCTAAGCAASLALLRGELGAAVRGYEAQLALALALDGGAQAEGVSSSGAGHYSLAAPGGACAGAVSAYAGLDRAHAARAEAGEDADGHAKAAAARVALFAALRKPPPAECAICAEALCVGDAAGGARGRPRLLRCNHAFHDACIRGWLEGQRRVSCPTCRQWVGSLTHEAALDAGGA